MGRAVGQALLAACLAAVLVPPGARAHSATGPGLRVPVLVLHHVKWDRPGDDATERGLTIHPTQLRQELGYLSRHRYTTVSAARVAAVLSGRGSLPPRSVVLTFDDGYADAFRTVYPALRSHHMTATFFVCPGLLGKRRYMTWRQVREMAGHGMDIEAHTLTHPDLAVVPRAQAWNEIRGSRVALEEHLRRRVAIFAYPYGAFNAGVLADVRKAGYAAAFTTEQGWTLKRSQRLVLPRVYVDRDDSIAQFAARLTGNLAVVSRDPT